MNGPGPREAEHAFGAIAIPVLFTLLFTYLLGGALSGPPRIARASPGKRSLQADFGSFVEVAGSFASAAA